MNELLLGVPVLIGATCWLAFIAVKLYNINETLKDINNTLWELYAARQRD